MPRTKVSNRRVPEHNFYDFRDLRKTTGNIFFVDSGVSTSGDGLSPETAKSTLNAAVALCSANNGDIIVVMEGHAETIDSAADVDVNVAGVTVLGLGVGAARPTFTFSTTADGTFAIGANSVWIENLLFLANFTNGVTVGIDIDDSHTDVTLNNIEMRATAATKEFLTGITIAASAIRPTIKNSYFFELVGDATAAIITEGACEDLTVENCRFWGTWTTAVLDLDAGTNVNLRPRILNNVAYNSDTAAGLFAAIDSGTVAFFMGNRSGIGKANTVPVTDATASIFIDNLATDAAAISELKYPATATAWS